VPAGPRYQRRAVLRSKGCVSRERATVIKYIIKGFCRPVPLEQPLAEHLCDEVCMQVQSEFVSRISSAISSQPSASPVLNLVRVVLSVDCSSCLSIRTLLSDTFEPGVQSGATDSRVATSSCLHNFCCAPYNSQARRPVRWHSNAWQATAGEHTRYYTGFAPPHSRADGNICRD
jgi:hypothetical protein